MAFSSKLIVKAPTLPSKPLLSLEDPRRSSQDWQSNRLSDFLLTQLSPREVVLQPGFQCPQGYCGISFSYLSLTGQGGQDAVHTVPPGVGLRGARSEEKKNKGREDSHCSRKSHTLCPLATPPSLTHPEFCYRVQATLEFGILLPPLPEVQDYIFMALSRDLVLLFPFSFLFLSLFCLRQDFLV